MLVIVGSRIWISRGRMLCTAAWRAGGDYSTQRLSFVLYEGIMTDTSHLRSKHLKALTIPSCLAS